MHKGHTHTNSALVKSNCPDYWQVPFSSRDWQRLSNREVWCIGGPTEAMWVSIGLLGSPNHPQSIQDHPTQTFCFNSQAAYHSYHTSSLLLHLFMEIYFYQTHFLSDPGPLTLTLTLTLTLMLVLVMKLMLTLTLRWCWCRCWCWCWCSRWNRCWCRCWLTLMLM